MSRSRRRSLLRPRRGGLPLRLALLGLIVAAFSSNGCAPGNKQEIELEVVDADGLEAYLDRYRGRVVLVDFWATWCVPCLRAFPELCDWQQQYGPRGLTILAVSIDAPEDLEEKVVPFLSRQPMALEAVLLDPEHIGELSERWSRRWRTEVPARFLFDREGKKIGEYFAEVPPAELEEEILLTLDEPSS